MTRPRLLDLFCGAGGAAMGYHRAGFDVVGVDIKPQPHYPFEFYQMDALAVLTANRIWLQFFDVIHASPPCQAYTAAQSIRKNTHPDLLGPVRDALQRVGVPWVIENVEGAPMRADAMLCGSMFGLEVQRHRLFEFWRPTLVFTPLCNHVWKHGRPVGVYGHTGGKSTGITSGNHGFTAADWREAMDIDWMNRDELAESIPPAYSKWIGDRLLADARVVAA